MEKIKIVHIHTDFKFIFAAKSFENPYVQNVTVYFGHKSLLKYDFESERFQCTSRKKDIDWLINYCNDAKYVVLWGLCPLKIYLINELPITVKKIWRLFGSEVYRNYKSEFLSEKTLPYVGDEKIKPIMKIASKVKNMIFGKVSVSDFNIVQVFNKIDFLMGLSFDEYQLIKKLLPGLPSFLQAPDWPINDYGFQPSSVDRTKIVLGISREVWNNYLDILENIQNEKYCDSYSFDVLFNYGTENLYTKNIRKIVENRKNIILIEGFMDKDELTLFYNQTIALVVNSYRQCGMGSIFSALRAGVKIYLNSKNIMYEWLSKEGFIVHTIEEFFETLQSNTLEYNFAEAMHNANNFKNLSQRYSIEKFQEEIFKDILAIYNK